MLYEELSPSISSDACWPKSFFFSPSALRFSLCRLKAGGSGRNFNLPSHCRRRLKLDPPPPLLRSRCAFTFNFGFWGRKRCFNSSEAIQRGCESIDGSFINFNNARKKFAGVRSLRAQNVSEFSPVSFRHSSAHDNQLTAE